LKRKTLKIEQLKQKKKYNEEVVLRGGPEKKEKKEKVAKRAKTAFHFYTADKRIELKASKPELSPKELTAAVTAAWKGLSTDDKKPYEEKAKEAKETFKKEEKEKEKEKKPPAKKAKKDEKDEKDDDDDDDDDDDEDDDE